MITSGLLPPCSAKWRLAQRMRPVGAARPQPVGHAATDDPLAREPAAALEHLVREEVAELGVDHRDRAGDVRGEMPELRFLALEIAPQLVVLLDVDEADEHAEAVFL